ncbi:hypothetical protein QTJ16_006694 [Diplocarpon rosae]|uniref:Vacuolar membrane protein n=1 Tax=Diplocarpon rosae TaxID=946125 RepID=A0AAD9WAC2_9HELO|nr:hypothetical protein QTJ16_006694 [Diplocarpon rosae]
MLPPPGFEVSSENASATSTLLSAALATAIALAPTTTSVSSPHDPPPKNGECELLGPFAILVQGALGACALLALVFKRWRERPQRPVKIWFFDVSKQVVGSVLLHVANLLMSMLSSGQFSIKLEAGAVASRMVDEQEKYTPNPCSFYLLNLAIDTTIGIPILIFLLRILTSLFLLTPVGVPPESISSGNYGSPPRAWWWFKQSLIYFLGLMGMKICVLIIFLVLPWISRVGDWALRWTEGDETLQVIFVMLVFPVIMNATQYYIIDSFIKNPKPEGHELIPGEDGAEDASSDFAEGSCDGMDSCDDSEDGDKEIRAKATAEAVRRKERRQGSSSSGKPLQTGSKDYDPLFDGESSPTIVGSASTRERDPLALKEVSEDESVGR